MDFLRKDMFWRKLFQKINFSNIQHSFSLLSFFGMFIEKASLCPDELIEGIFLWINTFYEFFQNLSRILSYFVNKISTVRQICVSSVFINFFLAIFLTWNLKAVEKLFPEIELFVFVKVRSKITYYFWKVSARLSKLVSTSLEGFFG